MDCSCCRVPPVLLVLRYWTHVFTCWYCYRSTTFAAHTWFLSLWTVHLRPCAFSRRRELGAPLDSRVCSLSKKSYFVCFFVFTETSFGIQRCWFRCKYQSHQKRFTTTATYQCNVLLLLLLLSDQWCHNKSLEISCEKKWGKKEATSYPCVLLNFYSIYAQFFVLFRLAMLSNGG